MKRLSQKFSTKGQSNSGLASQIKMAPHTLNLRPKCWFSKVRLGQRYPPVVYLALLIATFASISSVHNVASSETDSPPGSTIVTTAGEAANSIPSNHRPSSSDDLSNTTGNSNGEIKSTSRQGRQYDGPVSASSSTGSYSTIGVGSDGAYVSQASPNPLFGSGASSGGAYATSDLTGAYHNPNAYHTVDPMLMARGYSPQAAYYGHGGGYPTTASLPAPSSPLFPTGGPFGGTSLMGPKGFDVAEIVCTAIAVAIGAVIVGAPFILIYLFFMNHMNGGPGGPGLGPNAGPITLTGPNTSNQSGRRKRHTSLPEALFKQLSPLVNSEQVANTFKTLMSSISKYQM